MNNPNEARCERERDRAGYFRKIAYALRDAFGLGIIGFDPDFLMVADEIRKSIDIPEFFALKLLAKVNADAKRIAELEGCVATAVGVLEHLGRSSLSSTETVRLVTNTLAVIAASPSASDTPMAGKEAK